ncbi:MAG: tetratricopeptide repeat protein [Halioglobus sp.]
METYDTEEEQVEALRRWWDENGRSIILAVIVALSAGFGWQQWKGYDQQNSEGASDIYQAMLQSVNVERSSGEKNPVTTEMAVQLKSEYPGTTYAQFGALQLASAAVADNDLAEAEIQLRWVLSKADKGGDIAQVTELRLARVLAAAGKAEQALEILQGNSSGQYAASYAMARGDVLLEQGRTDEARDAYGDARAAAGMSGGQVSMATLDQKLQSLNPQPARTLEAGSDTEAPTTEIVEPVTEEEE